MAMETLDEQGFIFLGAGDNRPYRCAMWGDHPWLFYWHPDKHWVSMRRVNQSEIWSMPKNLTDEEQQHYRDLHAKWEEKVRG